MKLRKLIESDRKQDVKVYPENNSESFYRQQLHMSSKFYTLFNMFCYIAHIMNSPFLTWYVSVLFIVSEKV